MNEDKLNLDDLNQSKPLPEILEAEWAKDQVAQLFADLAAGAVVEHVQLKTIDSDGEVTLPTAQAAFDRGQAIAIQVRYVFENERWCDTLLTTDPTTKIIRTRLPSENRPGGTSND